MTEARRKVLSLAICASSHEVGFGSAQESAIELLTVMMESFFQEAARGSRLMAEHNGRSEATPNDVLLSLIEMGISIESLNEYGKKRQPTRIPAPTRESQQNQPTLLHTGQNKPHPPHIPDHYPPFPDSHAYIRTTAHRQPITEYEAVRDKAASQKRDLERALTRFMAKIDVQVPGHSLFSQNPNLDKYFPLIPIQPSNFPTMDALIPKDQIFDDD